MRISSCRPPRSVSGLVCVNRGTYLWRRTRFGSFGLGLGGSCRISCYFPSRPADPPPVRELGAIWINMTTHTGVQDRLAFCPKLPLFCRHFLVPRWLSLTIYFCPFRLRRAFSLVLFCVPRRLRNLTVKRCGSGF